MFFSVLFRSMNPVDEQRNFCKDDKMKVSSGIINRIGSIFFLFSVGVLGVSVALSQPAAAAAANGMSRRAMAASSMAMK